RAVNELEGQLRKALKIAESDAFDDGRVVAVTGGFGADSGGEEGFWNFGEAKEGGIGRIEETLFCEETLLFPLAQDAAQTSQNPAVYMGMPKSAEQLNRYNVRQSTSAKRERGLGHPIPAKQFHSKANHAATQARIPAVGQHLGNAHVPSIVRDVEGR